jgi:hypothetical protein
MPCLVYDVKASTMHTSLTHLDIQNLKCTSLDPATAMRTLPILFMNVNHAGSRTKLTSLFSTLRRRLPVQFFVQRFGFKTCLIFLFYFLIVT